MASNSFGNIFRITTWGESHGKAIGVVIDGCPAGMFLSNDDINLGLSRRAPGQNPYTSPRNEPDIAEIYSGIFDGVTTGAPISIIINNKDQDSSKYEPIKHLLRPGHANFTYSKKYGVFDYRGGGRASARETASRVAAGVVAQKILDQFEIKVLSCIKSIGKIRLDDFYVIDFNKRSLISNSPIFSPDLEIEKTMIAEIEKAKLSGDSLGGVVEFVIQNVPAGLGDPIYENLEANLAKGMMSLPATKGFEIGEGFIASQMKGSEHNDLFRNKSTDLELSESTTGIEASKIFSTLYIETDTNHALGTLGGISTGMPIRGRVAFKPTSSINKEQDTIDYSGKVEKFKLPAGSRHDPCVAIRAVPVVTAMCQIVMADALLLNRCVRVKEDE